MKIINKSVVTGLLLLFAHSVTTPEASAFFWRWKRCGHHDHHGCGNGHHGGNGRCCWGCCDHCHQHQDDVVTIEECKPAPAPAAPAAPAPAAAPAAAPALVYAPVMAFMPVIPCVPVMPCMQCCAPCYSYPQYYAAQAYPSAYAAAPAYAPYPPPQYAAPQYPAPQYPPPPGYGQPPLAYPPPPPPSNNAFYGSVQPTNYSYPHHYYR